MKYIPLKATRSFTNSKVCTGIEYPLGDKDINATVIRLKGRYPDKGVALNIKCKEVAYVIKGSGKLTVGNKTVELKVGDVVLVDKGEKYFWEGNMELFMPSTPAWYPEQHKVDDF